MAAPGRRDAADLHASQALTTGACGVRAPGHDRDRPTTRCETVGQQPCLRLSAADDRVVGLSEHADRVAFAPPADTVGSALVGAWCHRNSRRN
jgi:hypothetical protein